MSFGWKFWKWRETKTDKKDINLDLESEIVKFDKFKTSDGEEFVSKEQALHHQKCITLLAMYSREGGNFDQMIHKLVSDYERAATILLQDSGKSVIRGTE